MFFKKLDYLSPTITFYYKGSLSHSSIPSGIISVISLIIIIYFSIYFSLEIFMRHNPITNYFSAFVGDAGEFPINSSSFFHFISMVEDNSNPKELVNFENFRIIGFDSYFEHVYINGDIKSFDHWLYGYCNNQSDTQEISYLINQNYFENSACIRKYFNSREQKYYNTDDKNFRWPNIAHGTYNKNNTFYLVTLEKCKEDTINDILGKGYHCNDDKKIDEIISHHGVIHFNFIDNYIDVLNYKKPITKFFYRIENSLDKDNYSINHLNINPTLINTNNGLIFNNVIQELSYSYERNDVYNYETGNNGVYMAFYLWLNNKMFYYERIYRRIQDLLSDIGGIIQFISLLATLINYLYSNYIILIDTENLISTSIDSEKKRNKIYKSNHTKKIKYFKSNDNDELERDKSNSIIKKNTERKNYYSNKLNRTYDQLKKEKENSKINNNSSTDYDGINEKYQKQEEFNKNKENKNNEGGDVNNFWSFICYKISCKKEVNNFRIYEEFRKKIISEEHMIKNHLNIYNLLKVSKRKISSLKDSYHLKDIINYA